MGLGLYIARKFTELLHGKLTVESDPGSGSEFTVTILNRLAANAVDDLQKIRESILTPLIRVSLYGRLDHRLGFWIVKFFGVFTVRLSNRLIYPCTPQRQRINRAAIFSAGHWRRLMASRRSRFPLLDMTSRAMPPKPISSRN
jgi:histidine kinase/DNA gyrase B/HSP90-like ATPase